MATSMSLKEFFYDLLIAEIRDGVYHDVHQPTFHDEQDALELRLYVMEKVAPKRNN